MASIRDTFKKTKDVRLRWNIIFGSFIMINLAVLSLFFAYGKVVYSLFGTSILLEFVFSLYIYILSALLSYLYSFKFYYWQYQKELIKFTDKKENNISNLTMQTKINIYMYLVSMVFPFFLLSSFLIAYLVSRGIFRKEEFIVSLLILGFVSFRIFKIRLDTMQIDEFKKIKMSGLCTDYSSETKEITK